MKLYNKKKPKNNGIVELYGLHAVRAALKNTRRNHRKLVISQYHKGFITEYIKQNVEEISELPNKEMIKLYGRDNTHQGIVLVTSSLVQPNIDEILKDSVNKKTDVIVMLDQVTDPNNIGSIMRSCSLFNCKSIIVSKNNAPNITPSMGKAASGALEIINYIKVINLSHTIKKFKKNNYWIYGLDNYYKNFVNKFDIPKKCLLVLGSESKGLRKLKKKECDAIVSIPINHNSFFQIDSLNVSNACSIALYQHFNKYN